jgi:hypothetical protein
MKCPGDRNRKGDLGKRAIFRRLPRFLQKLTEFSMPPGPTRRALIAPGMRLDRRRAARSA